MSVIVQRRPTNTLSPDEIARWREVPSARSARQADSRACSAAP
jgi:hypothetical protein